MVYNSSVEQRCNMNAPTWAGPATVSSSLSQLSPPHSLHCRHTGFPDPQIHQAFSHLRAFAPAEPSVHKTFLSSDLGSSVTSSEMAFPDPSSIWEVLPIFLQYSNLTASFANLLSVKSGFCVRVYFCPFLCKVGIGLPCS